MANALKEFSRIAETSVSTGTGALTLAGAIAGFKPFSSVLANNDTCMAIISKDANWEISRCTYSLGSNNLTRTQVYRSTNADTPVNWGSGDKTIQLIKPGWSDLDAAGRAAMFEILASMSEVSIASAATTDILGAATAQVAITGVVTITSFGTGANKFRFVRFAGALTLTHNATTLILPGNANITTAAGDTCIVTSDASSNARIYAYQRAGGGLAPSGLASTTDVLTGTDIAKAVTPDALAALWRKGTPVAAAPTLVLGDGGVFVITAGTGPITDIDFGTASRDGRWAWLIFNTGVTLTHSLNLNLVGAADITTASQDMALIIQEVGDAVRMLTYQRANDGVLPSALASTTEVLTGTDAAKTVTPDALAALWEFGTSVAAAANIVLGEGGVFYVTGSGVTISDISFATGKGGRTAWLHFNNGHTLVNSANLLLPVAGNITVAQGDRLLVVQTGPTTREVLTYQRADGGGLALASTTEVLTGTDIAKAVTPDALAALWERGTDVASAATTIIGEGGYFSITGAVTITAFDFATVSRNGRFFSCRFTAALVLTHSATLILPGAANISAAIGDMATFVQSGTGSPDTFICLSYTCADGTVLAAATATTTEVLTGTNAAKLVTPDSLAALWEFTDITVAATTTLTEGGYFRMSGSAITITNIVFATPHDGRQCVMRFSISGIVLTAGASLFLPAVKATITTNAGDMAYCVQHPGPIFIIVNYVKADGTVLVADTSKVNIAGDTMTGDLTIAKANPTLLLNATSASAFAYLRSLVGNARLLAFQTGGTSRWGLNVDGAAESGGNVGSNFALRRYDDAGTLIDAPIAIDRATGQINLAAGLLAFPATQNPSAGVNVLDDYEEGTFSPDLTFGGLKVGLTYTTQLGAYTKIGRVVEFSMYVVLSAKGTSTGVAAFGGLPFVAGSSPHYMAAVYLTGAAGIGDTHLVGRVTNGASNITLYKQAAGAGTITQLTDADFIAASVIGVTGHYYV